MNDDRTYKSDERADASPQAIEAATEALRVELGLSPDDLRRPEIRAQYAGEIRARAESSNY